MDTNNLYWHKKLGVWLRKDTGDKYIPSEQKLWEPLQLKGKTVLDIGGHIGCFAVYAINYGADTVISVEPNPSNCEMYRLNTEGLDVELIERAVVEESYNQKTVKLYCVQGQDTAMHSLFPFRGRMSFDVKPIYLASLLSEFHPNTVKIDIEGGEYRLIDDIVSLFPEYGVKSLGIEVHILKKEWAEWVWPFIKKLNKCYRPVVAIPAPYDWRGKVGIWELR
jgi:FkbM family methyltransferase